MSCSDAVIFQCEMVARFSLFNVEFEIRPSPGFGYVCVKLLNVFVARFNYYPGLIPISVKSEYDHSENVNLVHIIQNYKPKILEYTKQIIRSEHLQILLFNSK